MELLERYLKAVRCSLPAAQQEDIVRELRENLLQQMEDRAAQLGRPLTGAEQEAVLKAHGHPILVAGKYRPDQGSVTFGRQWIGPELFPAYKRILKVNLGITLAVTVVLSIALSGRHHSPYPTLTGIVFNLLIQFAIITAIFVSVNRRLVQHPDRWDAHPFNLFPQARTGPRPRGLDAVAMQLIGKPYDHVPRWVSVGELGIGAIGVLWWHAAPWLVRGVMDATGFMDTGRAWRLFYLPCYALSVIALLRPIVNLVRPDWARFRTAGRMAVDGGFTILLVLVSRLGPWVVLADPDYATDAARRLVAGLNLGVGISVALVVVLTTAMFLLELRWLVNRPGTGAVAASSLPV